jgi:hypothetical protein
MGEKSIKIFISMVEKKICYCLADNNRAGHTRRVYADAE